VKYGVRTLFDLRGVQRGEGGWWQGHSVGEVLVMSSHRDFDQTVSEMCYTSHTNSISSNVGEQSKLEEWNSLATNT